MNANAASQLATRALHQKYAEHLDKIREAAAAGKLSVTLYWGGLTEEGINLRKFLENLGYDTTLEIYAGTIEVRWGLMKKSYERVQAERSLLQI